MSKMSQLHAELSEQAHALGYASIEAAEQMGYEVDWENQKLISAEEAAHKFVLKERDKVLDGLVAVYNDTDNSTEPAVSDDYKRRIKRAIDFIKQEIR